MDLNLAVRCTEIALAIVFIQQSLEHLFSQRDTRHLFTTRLFLSCILILGWYSSWILYALLIVSLFIINRFQGPYNGGNDRMGLLILICLCIFHIASNEYWQEISFGYLAIQVILSYFVAGVVKIVNPEWRNGRALGDVFEFSAYPVSESLRTLSNKPILLWCMSWGVVLFEVSFPLALITKNSLYIALFIGALFHLANAFLFGFNRFFWIWIASYPSLIWFQQRIFQ